MNLNQFMHPRNVFRKKPNFAELASRHLDLAQHLQETPNGKYRLDFDCAEAVQALTRVLLLEAFGLNVQLDPNRLVPAIPQRLNYLLWVQDIYRNVINTSNELWTGLDIGTGACAILPMLGCRLETNWSFLATDIDSQSVENANQNVRANQLAHRITVYQKSEQDGLLSPIVQSSRSVQFVVCNPPFFSHSPNQSPERTNRRVKSNANSAADFERVCEGGELAFVQKLFEESQTFADQVELFTVMLGRKETFVCLKRLLTEQGEHVRFVHSELCQGRTIRHAVAWTFQTKISLERVPCMKHKKTKAPLELIVRQDGLFKYLYNVTAVFDRLMIILNQDLRLPYVQVHYKRVNKCKLHLRSHLNSWSNQRRKRRQQQRQTENLHLEASSLECSVETNGGSVKRRLSESHKEGEQDEAREVDDEDKKQDDDLKIKAQMAKKAKQFDRKIDCDVIDQQTYVLHCEIVIKSNDQEQISLTVKELELSSDYQSMYQFYQYLKNQFQSLCAKTATDISIEQMQID